jgi:hypothetical protein
MIREVNLPEGAFRSMSPTPLLQAREFAFSQEPDTIK